MWAKLIDLKNTFEGKFLAVMLSVLLATSMVNFAAFAGDEVDQTGQGDGAATTEQTEPASETPEANEPPASQPAPEPPALQQPAPESPTATPPASEPSTGAVDEAVIALEMENAFIVVKGQQITGSTLNVPRQEELAFVATPDDGYEIDSVKAENAANADVPVATQDGTSKIAPEFVDSTLVITVKAKAVETDVPPTVETTPITNDIKIEPNGDVTEGESAATDGGSAVEEEDHSANFRSGRGIDIKDSITVEVGESKTYNGEDANYHRWAVQSGSDYVELSSTSSKAVVIKGKSAGTAVLKHSVKGWVGARQWTVKEYISVRVTEPAIQRVEFYYLQSPNANPDSNDTGQWGPMAGIGTADVSGANWQGGQDGKNIFDVSNRVKSWPSGLDGGTVAKTSEHWMTIFNQFKGEVEEDLGVTITPDDVESITLTPHKISRNNSTVPDKHVDCVPTIHVKNNILVQYTYHLWDAGDTRFQVTDRATVKGGSATSPQDNYTKGQTVKVAGRTYTFSGWYLNENLTGDPVKFPYTINENTDFWAKFIPSYFVDYDLDGGTWAETQSRFEYDSNDTVTVLSAVPAKPGYTFAGWAYSGGETTYNGGDSFTMPDQDVTLTAQWKSNEAKTSLWFYTTEGETGPYVWNGSALVGKDQADTNIWIGTISTEDKTGFTDDVIKGNAETVYKWTTEADKYETYEIWLVRDGETKEITKAELVGLTIKPGDEIRYHVVAEPGHTVTYLAGEHGTGSPYVDADRYFKGDNVALKSFAETGLAANPGWKFDHWKRNNLKVEDPFTMPYANVEFTAVYVADPALTYNVTYTTDGNGTVSPAVNNGIQVLGTDGVTGSTATANKTYRFEGWYVGDNKVLGATEELTADKAKEYINKNMKDDAWDGTYANTTFTAKFEAANTSIAVTKVWSDGAGGTPSITPEIKVNLLRNGEVFKEATIASGDTSYIFTDVPRKDADLNPYTYEVVEAQVGKTTVPADATSVQADIDGVEGKVNYEIAYSGDAGNGFVITNTMTNVLLTISNTVVDETIDSANGLAQTFKISMGPSLGNGQSITYAVNQGDKFTLSMTASQTTWKTTYSVNKGAAVEGTKVGSGQLEVNKDTTVAFTNTRVPLRYYVLKDWYVDKGITPPASLNYKVIQSTDQNAPFSEESGPVVAEGVLSDWGDPKADSENPGLDVYEKREAVEKLLPYASLSGDRYYYNTHEEKPENYAEPRNGWSGWSSGEGAQENDILTFTGILNNYYNVTSLSGTKTWSDGSENHNNADEVTLTL